MQAAPTARDLYDRGRSAPSDVRVTPTKAPSIDQRYRPTQTTAPTRARSTAKPSAVKPAPSASDRYRPADAVRSNSTAAAGRPRATTAGTTAAGRPAAAPSATVVRSASAPRLTSNSRSTVSGIAGAPRSTSWYPGGYPSGVYDPYCAPYYNPHCYSPFYFGCGSGFYGWGVSFWYPWFWCSSSVWYGCHSDWWWYNNSCYVPATASYWWYPSSVYCPSYLYVPSSVVVVESGEPEVVVAGSAVAGEARADGRTPEPRSLAEKYLELGDYYFRAGRFAEAAETYARARTYAPNDAGIHFVLADAAFATGDYHFAAFLIKEALRLDPTLATSAADKRSFYGDPKLFDAQMESLDKYLAEKPYDAMAQLVRGYNLLFSGQTTAAKVAFQRVLELSPGEPAAELFLAAIVGPTPAPEAAPAKPVETGR